MSAKKSLSLGVRLIIGIVASLFLALVVNGVMVYRGSSAQAEKLLVDKMRAITAMAEETRQYAASLHADGKTFRTKEMVAEAIAMVKEGKSYRDSSYYPTIPIVAAWIVAKKAAKSAGFRFRVPKEQPRNPANKPNPFERKMLRELKQNRSLKELYRVDESINALRFMRPVVLSKDCMGCHGTVADDSNGDGIDPIGFKMEGWKVGEVHGAFQVIAPLGPIQASIWTVLYQNLIGSVLIALIV